MRSVALARYPFGQKEGHLSVAFPDMRTRMTNALLKFVFAILCLAIIGKTIGMVILGARAPGAVTVGTTLE